MANPMCTRRLTKELAAYNKDPIQDPKIVIAPNESNILEMHYVIEGSKGTPYEGGIYHGKLIFPKDYPLKPPGVMMMTPSGRFKPGTRLCLSMSDFHPESWNPMWSIATILTGLYSFMIETSPTLGSIETPHRKKRQLAHASLAWNVHNSPNFCKLFPEYVELYNENKDKPPSPSTPKSTDHSSQAEGLEIPQRFFGLAGLLAIVSVILAYRWVV